MTTTPAAGTTPAQVPSATTPPATAAAQASPAAAVASAPAQRPATTAAPAAATATPATAAPEAAARTVVGMPTRPAKTTALAMQPAQPLQPDPPGAAGTIGGTLFALALVIGLIFGLAWLARRMPGLGGLRSGAGLRIVTSLPLGTRERLVVVEVGGTQLLLGTGAAGTRLLHTLDTPLPGEAPVQPAPFAQLLAQRLGKKPA